MHVPKSLPMIPPQRYQYHEYLKFVTHWEATVSEFLAFPPRLRWFVFGPADKMPPGSTVEVRKKEDDSATVIILDWIAQRLVNKKNGSTVQFVLATFDSVMEENDDAGPVGNAADGDAGDLDDRDPLEQAWGPGVADGAPYGSLG